MTAREYVSHAREYVSHAHIVILTGERNVGKTTVCRETVALAQARGYTCSGVLTLSYAKDVRDVLDVRSGHVRRLTLEPDTDAPTVTLGRFRFDPETLAWGNNVLAHALPSHLFVVDELGPLEVERNEGWRVAFDLLRKTNFTLALAVVRPELLEQVQLELPTDSTTVLTVNKHNRDDLPATFLEMLEGN
ncbi:MAG: nucleoside-triphosphatase [Anaerolineae bacterium]